MELAKFRGKSCCLPSSISSRFDPVIWKLDIWSWWASDRLGRVPRILIIRWNIVFVWYLRYQAEDWETCFKTLSGKSLGPTSSPVSMHRSVVFIKTRSGRWLLGLNFERFSSSHDKTVTKTYQNTESTETAYACCGIFVCGKCNQPNLEAKVAVYLWSCNMTIKILFLHFSTKSISPSYR